MLDSSNLDREEPISIESAVCTCINQVLWNLHGYILFVSLKEAKKKKKEKIKATFIFISWKKKIQFMIHSNGVLDMSWPILEAPF